MTLEQHALITLLSKGLFGNPAVLPEVDFKALLKEADSQAVNAIVSNAAADIFDDESWKKRALATVSNNIRVFYNHKTLHQWMIESDVPYVILKGCASASYYPDPLLRGMGDVDFLVLKSEMAKADNVLKLHGMKSWDQAHPSHIVYGGNSMHYEMHFRIAGLPDGKAGELLEEYLSDIFKKAELKTVGDSSMMLPSDFHHGLILLLHTCHHMTGEGIGLRHLCDWAVFENSFSDAEFREMFEKKLKAVGLWRFAQILTQISIKYLGAGKRDWAGEADSVADGLMEDILSSGNFGTKDKNRSTQTMLISNRGKNGVGRTKTASQFAKSVNEFICLKIPAAKRHKLLLIPGWIFYGVRYGVRIITGKRKNPLKRDVIEGASKRRELYKQLKLYELTE